MLRPSDRAVNENRRKWPRWPQWGRKRTGGVDDRHDLLRQVVEQRLGVDEVARGEAFGERRVDRGEEVAGFGALALIAPEAGEGRRGAPPEGAGAPLAGAGGGGGVGGGGPARGAAPRA